VAVPEDSHHLAEDGDELVGRPGRGGPGAEVAPERLRVDALEIEVAVVKGHVFAEGVERGPVVDLRQVGLAHGRRLRAEDEQVGQRRPALAVLEVAEPLAVQPEGVGATGLQLHGDDAGLLVRVEFDLPVDLRERARGGCETDQLPSVIALLKVTRISLIVGSTSPDPASGTVFTTTGGAVSSVISWAESDRHAATTTTRPSNRRCFMSEPPG
jgi:hypothetical protein